MSESKDKKQTLERSEEFYESKAWTNGIVWTGRGGGLENVPMTDAELEAAARTTMYLRENKEEVLRQIHQAWVDGQNRPWKK